MKKTLSLFNFEAGRRRAPGRTFTTGLLFIFHGAGKSGLQARHLQLASCLHFLRQKIGGLQVRHLKSASCLLSEMKQ